MAQKNVKPMEVDVDAILEEIGFKNKYHVRQFTCLILSVLLSALHMSNYIFSAPYVNHRCHVPECEGKNVDFKPPWLDNAISPDDRCFRYAPDNFTSRDSANSTIDHFTCPAEWFDQTKKINCEKIVYLENDSFIEEMDIGCEDWKIAVIGTCHSIGTLLALPMVGPFSDRYGRRTALLVAGVLASVLGFIKAFAVNYPMFVAFEILEPTLGSGMYTACFILAFELLTSEKRTMTLILINVASASGAIFMSIIAWLTPYWRTFILVIYAPSFLVILFFWLIDDSVRWLVTKKRYKDAIRIIEKMGNKNNDSNPIKPMQSLYYNAEHADEFNDDASAENRKDTLEIKHLFKSKILVGRILKCSFFWMTCAFCFYGISINSTLLGGSRYVNYMLTASVEVPAHIIGFFAMNQFGRKRVICADYAIAGISLLTFAFIPKDCHKLSLMLFLIGKLCVSMAFSGIYLYTSELFPTSLRHSILAMCSTIGRVGSIVAPMTPLLAVYMKQLPSLMFGTTCIIAGILMLTSPETHKVKLPETFQEAEHIFSQQKKREIDVKI